MYQEPYNSRHSQYSTCNTKKYQEQTYTKLHVCVKVMQHYTHKSIKFVVGYIHFRLVSKVHKALQ